MTKEVWFYAGEIEVWRNDRNRMRIEWRAAYSRLMPDGATVYPWVGKREAQCEARERGARGVFYASEKEARETLAG